MTSTADDPCTCPRCGWRLFEYDAEGEHSDGASVRRIRATALTPAFTEYDRPRDTCKAICPECETRFAVRISRLWPQD